MGQITPADVAELADALDSGSSVLTDVEVQILSSALQKQGFPASRWKLLFFCVCPDYQMTTVTEISRSIDTCNELTTTIRTQVNFPLLVIQQSRFTIRTFNVSLNAERFLE